MFFPHYPFNSLCYHQPAPLEEAAIVQKLYDDNKTQPEKINSALWYVAFAENCLEEFMLKFSLKQLKQRLS